MFKTTSRALREAVSKFGWELIDEFGTDLQIEMNETEGSKVHLRLVDYAERRFREDEREYMVEMLKSWMQDNPEFDATQDDDAFEFEFEMTAWRR